MADVEKALKIAKDAILARPKMLSLQSGDADYQNDPVYAHMARIVGPDEATKHYKRIDKVVDLVSGKTGLFDYDRLHEVPKVDQFDLDRYDPPRGVSARIKDVLGNKDVQSKMSDYIDEGVRMGGPRWYNADPLLDHFKKVLGGGGEKAFRKYMDFVAATSPRSEVGANARNASYYYHRAMKGLGMPEVGEANPSPYGHKAQRLHQMNARQVAEDGWNPLKNPKPASFVENLVGNQRPGTIDTHAFRAPAMIAEDPRFLATDYQASKTSPKRNLQKEVESGDLSIEDAVKMPAGWQTVPKDNEYKAIEGFYRDMGREKGLTTAQTQASSWIGAGKLTGLGSDESKPFLRFLEDRIVRTAVEKKMDPEDVLHAFIRGEMPLLATGGAVNAKAYATGGAVDQDAPPSKAELRTDAQVAAGNYKKHHTVFQGIPITIENQKGTTRRGKGWQVEVPYHYGYIKRTEGADGDHVDVCLGDSPHSNAVFIIDQKDLSTGKFDEHKVMLGYDSKEEALEHYRKGFSDGKGEERIGAVVRMTVPELKGWLANGNTKKATRSQKLLDKALAMAKGN